MSQPSCFDCRFFATLDDVRAADLTAADQPKCLQGYCRRNPPTPGRFRGEDESLEYDYGQWPLVLTCDWCGAFAPWRDRDGSGTRRLRCVGPGGVVGVGLANGSPRGTRRVRLRVVRLQKLQIAEHISAK